MEDLHWADEASLELLGKIIPALSHLPVLVIGTYRDDEMPALGTRYPDVATLTLQRLASPEIAMLSQSILGSAGNSPNLVNLLRQETEGNAFFVVEVVRALAEHAGSLNKISTAELPITVITGGIQQILQRRLTFITEADLAILRLAAVLGRDLDLVVLEHATAKQADEGWLTRCAAAAVLERQDKLWRFVHDKLRSAVLVDLPEDIRPGLHRVIAGALEETYPEGKAFSAALAHHWSMAGEAVKEAHYAIAAGNYALSLNAYLDARKHLARALEVLATLPDSEAARRERIDALLTLVQASIAADPPATQLTRLEEAETLLKSLPEGDRRRELTIAYWRGRAFMYKNELLQALGQFQQVLAGAKELNDPEMIAIPSNAIGVATTFRGQHAKGKPLLQQARMLFEKLGNWREWVSASSFYGVALASMGEFEEAKQSVQAAIQRAIQMNDHSLLASSHGPACWVYYQTNDIDEMVNQSQHSAAAAAKMGNKVFEYMALGYQAIAHSQRGNHKDALTVVAQRSALKAELGGGPIIMDDIFGALISEVLANAGEFDQAAGLATAILQIAEKIGNPTSEAIARRTLGRVCAQRSEWAESDTHMSRAVELLEGNISPPELARTRTLWGAALHQRGDLNGAKSQWTHAAELFEKHGLKAELAAVQQRLARII